MNKFFIGRIHKGEVDFVAVNGKDITPYSVTWEI